MEKSDIFCLGVVVGIYLIYFIEKIIEKNKD
jgi:hypothetical protein